MSETALPKAERLARALNDVMSGGRGFSSILAAQARDELRACMVRETAAKVRESDLTEALALADALMSGANMNVSVVQRKVSAALSVKP